jgi:hypothetical protein
MGIIDWLVLLLMILSIVEAIREARRKEWTAFAISVIFFVIMAYLWRGIWFYFWGLITGTPWIPGATLEQIMSGEKRYYVIIAVGVVVLMVVGALCSMIGISESSIMGFVAGVSVSAVVGSLWHDSVLRIRVDELREAYQEEKTRTRAARIERRQYERKALRVISAKEWTEAAGNDRRIRDLVKRRVEDIVLHNQRQDDGVWVSSRGALLVSAPVRSAQDPIFF